MTVINQSDNADYTSHDLGVLLPVIGATLWANLGDPVQSLVNQADISKPLVVGAGSPVFHGDYVSLSDDTAAGARAVLDTQAAETESLTWFAVARKTGPGSTFRFMTNNNGGQTSTTLYSSATMASFRPIKDGANAAAGIAAAIASFVLISGRYENGIGYSVLNLSAGTKTVVPLATPRTISNTDKIRLGGSRITVGAAGSGNDMAFAAAYPRALSDAEVALVAKRIRALMAAKTVPIAV